MLQTSASRSSARGKPGIGDHKAFENVLVKGEIFQNSP